MMLLSNGSKYRLSKKNISSEIRNVSTPRLASVSNSFVIKSGDQYRILRESDELMPSPLSSRFTILIIQKLQANRQPSEV